jgi:hypothetical protein
MKELMLDGRAAVLKTKILEKRNMAFDDSREP